jgi:hypothetical protein
MRTSLAMRAALAGTEPMSRSTTSIRPLSSIWCASCGLSTCNAVATTVPTSATVSATVFWSRWNTARWASSAAPRKRLRNGGAPTTPEMADAMIGRADSRSSSWRSTTPSVNRSLTSARTLGSLRVAAARSANWLESKNARRA